VFDHATVTFAAGSARESVRTDPGHLFTGATITITPIVRTRRPEDGDKPFFDE
jgi:hypothetical protein